MEYPLLTNILVYTLFAGMAGALGNVVVKIVQKSTSTKANLNWITVILVILSFQVSKLAIAELRVNYLVEKSLVELRKEKLFNILFDYHPELESRIKDKFAEAFRKSKNESEVLENIFNVSSKLTESYFQKYFLNASDDSIHNYLVVNFNVIKTLQNNHNACIAFGLDNYSSELITTFKNKSIVNELSAAKADIIETSYTKPSDFQRMHPDDVTSFLAKAYAMKNIDPLQLDKLGTLQELSKEESCRVLTDFFYILANLKNEQAAMVFKNLYQLEN